MPTIDFTPNPHDPDRWLRCARCGKPVDGILVDGEAGRYFDITVACHGETEHASVHEHMVLRDGSNPLRLPPAWRKGFAFAGAPMTRSSLSAACEAILEEIIRETVAKYTGEKLSPALLQAMGTEATLAARDPDNGQPALAFVRITYHPTPGVAGSVGAHVDLSPPNRNGVRIPDREWRRETLGEWRDHPADAAVYAHRSVKEEERRSTARRNAMTPEQWGHNRDAAGICVVCKADRTMWCDTVVHERMRAIANPRPMTYAELAEPPLTEDAKKRLDDDTAHVLAWAMFNLELRQAMDRFGRVLRSIEFIRQTHVERQESISIAGAVIIAILRVCSRAWASNPSGIELDLEPINHSPEAGSIVACDDAELRFALLEIETTQKG